MDEQEKDLEEILRMFDKAPSSSSERNNQAQMRQNNLQSRQVSQNPERTVRTTNQTANKRKPPSSKGRYLSPKRQAAIKRRKRQRAVIVSLFALLIVILIVVLICKGCAGGKKDLSVLQGTWYYDQYTEYEFDGKGNIDCRQKHLVLSIIIDCAIPSHNHKIGKVRKKLDEHQLEERTAILRELLPNTPNLPSLQAPVYFDYGCNTYFGKFSGTNFNFTCLDVCPVHIGDNVMIGPNVTLATPMHPMLPEERNIKQREDGSYYNLEYAKPITIENNCWLASNVVVCGGVTIGEGSVIGAGSVVTRSIPPYSFAAGNPCRVIRELTEEDRMKQNI